MDHDEFLALQLDTLKAWITAQRQEGLHLDFKVAAQNGDLSRDDRKNLSKAISGFSNADGGIIVWGIECRKDAEGVDCAQAFIPFANVHVALTALQGLTPDAVVPRLSRVEHRAIHIDQSGSGVVVTFVPPSDAGPHMAMLGERRYYKRNAASFCVMEHFDIADMFGRRARPELKLSLVAHAKGGSSGPNGRVSHLEVVFGIENVGRGLAKFPLIRARVEPPHRISTYELDGNGNAGLKKQTRNTGEPAWRSYVGGADSVIHSGEVLEVSMVAIDVPEGVKTVQDLVIEYVLSAEGVSSQTLTSRLLGTELHELAMNDLKRRFPQ